MSAPASMPGSLGWRSGCACGARNERTVVDRRHHPRAHAAGPLRLRLDWLPRWSGVSCCINSASKGSAACPDSTQSHSPSFYLPTVAGTGVDHRTVKDPRASYSPASSWRVSSRRFRRYTVTTDPTGRYVADLPAGTYTIVRSLGSPSREAWAERNIYRRLRGIAPNFPAGNVARGEAGSGLLVAGETAADKPFAVEGRDIASRRTRRVPCWP